jgi:hypothetical protein
MNYLPLQFKEAFTLAPEYLFGLACCRAGVPVMMVAPPSGGKTTIIYAIEKRLKEKGEAVQTVSRLNLRGLKELADWLKGSREATLLNEDYALLGSSDYMIQKMAELVGALSYSKRYQDFGLKVNIMMDKLGFVSGIQPQWVEGLMTHQAFATHIREKFLRYYVLPFEPCEAIPMPIAINLLVENTRETGANLNAEVPPELRGALSLQVGSDRANEFISPIVWELSRLIPPIELPNALRFYSERISWEQNFLQRELTKNGFSVETKWIAYHVLFWCLREGEVDRMRLMERLGVTSLRSVDRATDYALQSGWVTSRWNSDIKLYEASPQIREMVKWK